MKLGDFLNSINYNKNPLLDKDEKDTNLYNPYLVNRCLSFFTDTIFHANEMKHNGNFYRYNISKNDDKIVLKKKLLNCDSKKKNNDENLLVSSLEKVKI